MGEASWDKPFLCLTPNRRGAPSKPQAEAWYPSIPKKEQGRIPRQTESRDNLSRPLTCLSTGDGGDAGMPLLSPATAISVAGSARRGVGRRKKSGRRSLAPRSPRSLCPPVSRSRLEKKNLLPLPFLSVNHPPAAQAGRTHHHHTHTATALAQNSIYLRTPDERTPGSVEPCFSIEIK